MTIFRVQSPFQMNLPKVKAILFKGKMYKDGTHPIMIRITQNRKCTYKATGHSVVTDAWDEDEGKVYEKKPRISKRHEGQLNSSKLKEIKIRYSSALVLSNAKQINSVIADTIAEINTINNKLKANDERLDVSNIKKQINPNKDVDRNASFKAFAIEKQEKLLKAGAFNTYKRYKMIIHKLSEYKKKRDIKYSDIELEFLEDYENHLNSEGYMTNTIHNHFKTIRAIYYAAIKERIIPSENNPFFIFKLKMDSSTKKEKLTIEELLSIEKLKLEEGSLIWDCRNCFLFSFYCAGIRVSDLLQLKWENITSNGRIEYKMKKTSTEKSVALLPKALEILKHYKKPSNKGTDFIFPMLNSSVNLTIPRNLHNQISSKTALINKYLKKIALLADIEKPLSTHIARHSFSDIARKRGANIYDISKMLGHSSIKITEAYLSSLDMDSQDETHKKVLDF